MTIDLNSDGFITRLVPFIKTLIDTGHRGSNNVPFIKTLIDTGPRGSNSVECL